LPPLDVSTGLLQELVGYATLTHPTH